MKKKIAICLFLATGIGTGLFAQESPLVTDKPGTFKILNRTDYVGYDCGFTKTEITANLERIADVVSVIRQNPVLTDIRGFEGRARIYNLNCKEVSRYGVPSRISFEFSSWFRRKDGTIVMNAIEPPEWSLYINQAKPGWGSSYSQNAKHGYFTAPLRKRTVEPGIDVYDSEWFVIYDPSRAPYWIPVTVSEAFAAVREANKTASQYLKDFIEKEWNDIPEDFRDKPAYFGGGISKVYHKPGADGMDSIFPRIVKVNPDYWNRELPRSAIQIINFNAVQNKDYLRRLKEEYLENNSTSHDLKRFEESFGMEDIIRLLPLIGK